MKALRCAARASGAFTAQGDRWRFTGALTLDDAAVVYATAKTLALPASGTVDFAGLEHADSAALAVLLALKRRANAEGRGLNFVALPPTMHALARVYGVEGLILG